VFCLCPESAKFAVKAGIKPTAYRDVVKLRKKEELVVTLPASPKEPKDQICRKLKQLLMVHQKELKFVHNVLNQVRLKEHTKNLIKIIIKKGVSINYMLNSLYYFS